jgi:hypothetical protein
LNSRPPLVDYQSKSNAMNSAPPPLLQRGAVEAQPVFRV